MENEKIVCIKGGFIMPGLEDLFDVSDYKKNEKGKKVSKPKETRTE